MPGTALSRYLPGVRPTAKASTCVLLGFLAVAACGPRNPEDAYRRLAESLHLGDLEATYDALDRDSRWAWMTVQRCHREAYDIVLSNFPPGDDREAGLRRFEAGALSENAGQFFAAHTGAEALRALKARLPDQPVFEGQADSVTVKGRDGQPLPFQRHDGRWGFAGFQAAALDAQKRATADLEIIQRSATDYERAAQRGKP